MSKQSGLSRSKSSKETQEETVKQAQSQQYRHQSNILDITLLPPPSTLYPIHTPLQRKFGILRLISLRFASTSQEVDVSAILANKSAFGKRKVLSSKSVMDLALTFQKPKVIFYFPLHYS